MGVDGLSLWLLALAAVVFLLVVVATCWRPPERPRAFLAMVLLAETGLLGLFAAGQLVLFYVFWEAMLIPFYFLIGMWGGEGRGRATARFVIYTMVGSLLMLVAILATAFVAQDITGQFTFVIRDLVGRRVLPDRERLAVRRLRAGLRDQAAAVAVPRLAARRLPRRADPRDRPARGGHEQGRRLRLPADRACPCSPRAPTRFAIPIGVLAVIGIVYGSLVAWRAPTMRLLVAYSSLAHLGFIAMGIVAFDLQASQGAVLQMVNHGIVVAAAFAIVGIINRAAPDDRIDGIGGLAAGGPAPGRRLPDRRDGVAGDPRARTRSWASSSSSPASSASSRWLAVLACIGIVYAAVYMLRLYQTLDERPAPRRARAGRRAARRATSPTCCPWSRSCS